MLFKKIMLYFFGFYEIEVEGLYIQRFINLAASKKISIVSSKLEKSTVLRCRVFIKDINVLKEISEKAGCLISIKRAKGVPIFFRKYRKRKGFAVTVLVIAFFIYLNSLFIWHIEIQIDGFEKNKYKENDDNNEEIVLLEESIMNTLDENEIRRGKTKSEIENRKEEIINKLGLEFNNINWIGMEIKGTNLIMKIELGIENENDEEDELGLEGNNIYANKSGKISKITVLSGTARKVVGDEVNEGDILVEGVIEGKYTGIRNVEAKAEIFIENVIKYEIERDLKIEVKEKTGNIENKVEIYINNFKINFHKRLLNFENYDTIRENRIVKLFSNYYLPIEIVLLKNEEWKLVERTYKPEELTEILFLEINERFNDEYDVANFEKIDIEKQTKEENGKVKLTVNYKVQEKIGTKRD